MTASAHIVELCRALYETLPHTEALRDIAVVVTGEVNATGLGEVERRGRRQENCLNVTLSLFFRDEFLM